MEIDIEELKKVTLYCPTYKVDDNMNFIAFGDENNFKIAVFTTEEQYEAGYEYLKLDQQEQEYSLYTTDMELFIELAVNDDGFSGLIVNLPEDNMIVDSEKLASLK